MLSPLTEKNICELFVKISEGEEYLSNYKNSILSKYNINLIQIFFYLDYLNKSYLSKEDLFNFLNDNSFNCNMTDINYIFYFFDKDEDNKLNFYEFLNFIISDLKYSYKKAFRKKYKLGMFDNSDTSKNIEPNKIQAIIKIIEQEILFCHKICNIISNIKLCYDFSVKELFFSLKGYSYITKESINAFLERNKIICTPKNLANIMTRLDTKEMLGKISFNKIKNLFDIFQLDIKPNRILNKNLSNFNFNTYKNNYLQDNIITPKNNNNSRTNKQKTITRTETFVYHKKKVGKIFKKQNSNTVFQNYIRRKRDASIKKRGNQTSFIENRSTSNRLQFIENSKYLKEFPLELNKDNGNRIMKEHSYKNFQENQNLFTDKLMKYRSCYENNCYNRLSEETKNKSIIINKGSFLNLTQKVKKIHKKCINFH